MEKAALAGVHVVEFANMVSGPYCGKLLADLGAEVVKVEAPEGDPSRRCGPFPKGEPHAERSALFLYTNTSKQGIRLDLETGEGVEAFRDLLAWADILIDNNPPRTLEDLGLGWDVLQEAYPALIYTSITPYGRTGPRAGDKGDELTLIHAGGLGNLLPVRQANIDRPPVRMGGYQVGYHGALVAAVATVGALIAQRKTGSGQLIDISLQEVILGLISPIEAACRYHDLTWNRVPDRPPAMGRVQTSDGYVILNAIDDHHFRSLVELMGNPEWCASEEWDSRSYRTHHLMDIASKIDDWMLGQKKDEIHHKAAQKGIPIGPINTAEDVMNNAQYAARGYFTEVDHPEAGRHRYAGWPYKYSATPAKVSRPAPLLGQHTDEVLERIRSAPRREGSASKSNGRHKPLEGVRVLEFCWVFAGPYAGMLLAALGAEVIKVEGHTRTDLMRRSVIWPLSEPAPVWVPPNQGMSFNAINLNKKGLTLDLTTPEGLDLAKRLAAKADVVTDNMRPGALGKLGLDYEGLREIRPDIIAASSSSRGYEGPEGNYLGFAMIHHGIGGAAHITGYPDDHPSHTVGDVDIMNAIAFAYSIVAALYHRSQTGEGQFIDFSQCEGVSSLIGESLLGYEMTSEIPQRTGNAHEQYAPHNVYKAWGVDRWIAIEVHTDEEFGALAKVIGRPELAADPRFADGGSRKENEAALDEIVSSWTQERDRDWAVGEFTEAGVAAAPSRDPRDLFADPHLRAREAFVRITHPELDEFEVARPPWKMSACEFPTEHAPLLGEHNHYVLHDLLGMAESEIQDLREKGIIL